MSEEVKRLCNVIIAHVADGKTIFEKDHAAMIDTMRSQQAEIELLRDALAVYADACDATETTSCGYEGNMCCMTARAALGATQ